MKLARAALAPRYLPYTACIVASVVLLAASALHPGFLLPFAVAAALAALGTHDLLQTRHSVLRNYPISAHLRFMLESIRPSKPFE